MKKKRKLSKKKITKFIILIVVIVALCVGVFFAAKTFLGGKKEKEVKVVDNIEKYGYTLDENETKYYKSLFEDLKKVLNANEVDEEKYASLVSQLFLTDFFNLENKLSKNDVGGLQFVYTDFQGDFQKYAKDGVYQYLENDTYDDRKQELPKVSAVDIVNVEQSTFEYLDQADEKAYVVEAKISYEEDMGYQSTATLTLIHRDHKLEIAKMSK